MPESIPEVFPRKYKVIILVDIIWGDFPSKLRKQYLFAAEVVLMDMRPCMNAVEAM